MFRLPMTSQYTLARTRRRSELSMVMLSVSHPKPPAFGTLQHTAGNVPNKRPHTHAGCHTVIRGRSSFLDGGVNGIEQTEPVLIRNEMSLIRVAVRAVVDLIAAGTE